MSMLRIVLSRAALFPWLGIVLIAAGAALPEGSTVGVFLVVIGANLAFYSLRDFSQNFTWGPDARPMLNLCGLLFLLGLALMAVATQFESRVRWVALLSAGLYLCLFAVWTTQQPLNWPFHVLAVVAILLCFLGCIIAHLGWQEWRLFSESQETPQEITLSDLQRRGFGTNRYIRLKEFQFCDRSAQEQLRKDGKIYDLWIPVVAVDRQAVKIDGPVPPVPARIEVVAAHLTLGNVVTSKQRFGGRDFGDMMRKKGEEDGYECTVVTGIKTLKPDVRQQLNVLAPQTDFAEVVVLDWRKPSSAEYVYGFLSGGGAGFLLGLSALCLMYSRARKVVGVDSWSPHMEKWGEEGRDVATGQQGL